MTDIQIRCEHCRQIFQSPIAIRGPSEGFDATTIIGNRMQCPSCGQITGVNKENMRVIFDDGTGGFTGTDA